VTKEKETLKTIEKEPVMKENGKEEIKTTEGILLFFFFLDKI
jgi:hypothetical protein